MWLVRREFVFDPKISVSEHLQNGLESLVSYGALQFDGSDYQIRSVEYISEIYGLFRSILESYWVVLRKVGVHKLDSKDTVKRLLSKQNDYVEKGLISRPEAMTDINLKNAIRSMTEDHVFFINKKGHLEASTSDQESVMTWLNPMVNE